MKERAATSVGMDVDMSCPCHALSLSWPLIVGPGGPSRERAAIGTEDVTAKTATPTKVDSKLSGAHLESLRR